MIPFSRVFPKIALVGIIVLYLIFYLLNLTNPLFWDTIQYVGFQANFIYKNGLKTLFLPDQSGLFPFRSWSLAAWWFIFGKSLFTSHLFNMPALMLQAYALHSILCKSLQPKPSHLWWIWGCLLLESSWLSQIMLVSPDVYLIAFYLVCVLALLDKNYYLFTLGALLLSLVHIRGAILAGALTLVVYGDMWSTNHALKSRWLILSHLWILVMCAWQITQYQYMGWWISPPHSGRGVTDMSVVCFNIATVLKNHLDLGRAGFFII